MRRTFEPRPSRRAALAVLAALVGCGGPPVPAPPPAAKGGGREDRRVRGKGSADAKRPKAVPD